jgi:hypothetical protein
MNSTIKRIKRINTTAMAIITGPEVREKVSVGVVTVKAPVKFWGPLVAPVMMIFWAPSATVGMVIVPERLPLAFTVREWVAE